ncbi:hypothetical protein BB559_004837 [Furculomyces boomerangus]|uniref:non-specific serine/threonine protein kinase n=1 Tax=Furculomyces boomerangus TaxID=61424 RepID=A0A2T9YC89_9FUNG|nr:hypothetical protein BB559_004837 [Furculomyces boomerangus]
MILNKNTKPILPKPPIQTPAKTPNEQRFSKQKLVGRGAYGLVYRGYDNLKNKTVAIKIMDLDKNNESISDIQREISILSQLNSPHITSYIKSFVSDKNLWIVMDYAEGGSINKLLKAGSFEEKYTGLIMLGALSALEYLHKYGIMHRDVKAANILITQQGIVQLCDFGVARQTYVPEKQNKTYSFVGTPYWMAPEVINKEREYNYKADIWSAGITAYEIVTGSPPFAELDPKKALLFILQKGPPKLTSKHGSRDLQEFVRQCLQTDPKLRPSASELIKNNRFMRLAASNKNSTNLAVLIDKYKKWALENPEIVEKEFENIKELDEDNEDDQHRWIFDRFSSWNLETTEQAEENHSITKNYSANPENKKNGNLSIKPILNQPQKDIQISTNKTKNIKLSYPEINTTNKENSKIPSPMYIKESTTEDLNNILPNDKITPQTSPFHSTIGYFSELFKNPEDEAKALNKNRSLIGMIPNSRRNSEADAVGIEVSVIPQIRRSLSITGPHPTHDSKSKIPRNPVSATYSASSMSNLFSTRETSTWKIKTVADSVRRKLLRKKDHDIFRSYQKQQKKALEAQTKRFTNSNPNDSTEKSKTGKISSFISNSNISSNISFGSNDNTQSKFNPKTNEHAKNQLEIRPDIIYKESKSSFLSKKGKKNLSSLSRIKSASMKKLGQNGPWSSTPINLTPTSSTPKQTHFSQKDKSKVGQLTRYASEGISLYRVDPEGISTPKTEIGSSLLKNSTIPMGLLPKSYSEQGIARTRTSALKSHNKTNLFTDQNNADVRNSKDNLDVNQDIFQSSDKLKNPRGIEENFIDGPNKDNNDFGKYDYSNFGNNQASTHKNIKTNASVYTKGGIPSAYPSNQLRWSKKSFYPDMFVPISPLEQYSGWNRRKNLETHSHTLSNESAASRNSQSSSKNSYISIKFANRNNNIVLNVPDNQNHELSDSFDEVGASFEPTFHFGRNIQLAQQIGKNRVNNNIRNDVQTNFLKIPEAEVLGNAKNRSFDSEKAELSSSVGDSISIGSTNYSDNYYPNFLTSDINELQSQIHQVAGYINEMLDSINNEILHL